MQYFKRFQTKYRRRREYKTDYKARMRLIQQDKSKYETKKYRFVVRSTNQKIITQIVYAAPIGDHIICQANSTELARFGVTAGHKNYAAAYATGLLCARRILKHLKLDSLYEGVKGDDVNGDYIDAYRDDGEYINDDRKPFKAILDVGLTRTTTGNRMFGALKGLSDGGVYIKHNARRFPGFKVILPEEKGEKISETFDPEVHRKKIFGVFIDEHMKNDQDAAKERENNKQQFSKWRDCLKKSGHKTLEDLYESVHEEIRKNPDKVKADRKHAPVLKFNKDKTEMTNSKGTKWSRNIKLTNEQRKARAKARLAEIIAAAAEESD